MGLVLQLQLDQVVKQSQTWCQVHIQFLQLVLSFVGVKEFDIDLTDREIGEGLYRKSVKAVIFIL